MARLSRSELNCTLWVCVECQASGVITMDTESDRMPFGIAGSIESAHAKMSPDCKVGMEALHSFSPVGWYEETQKDAEL